MPFLRTSIITTIISARPIKIPGTIPAINRSPTFSPVMDAYTTYAILGGMTIAIELAAAMSAIANGALNPASTIAGIRIAPSAATVAGPEPEIAPKKHATMTQTIAIPPRLCPTQLSINLIRRLEIPAFAIIFPARMKNGIANNNVLLIPVYVLVATTVRLCPAVRIAATDDAPRQIAIGTSRIRSTKNTKKRTAVIITDCPPF